jgi:hypothetical protein
LFSENNIHIIRKIPPWELDGLAAVVIYRS